MEAEAKYDTKLLPMTDPKQFAQMIAMAPFVFQTALCLRDFEILSALMTKESSFGVLYEKIELSKYSLEVLLDAGESCGLLNSKNKVWSITSIGKMIQEDPLVQVNMNFSQDICYRSLFHLKEALATNTPAGLGVFGEWATLYEGLNKLPAKEKKSWFDFDNYFSDKCFQRAAEMIYENPPKKLMDVGGNNGKFALICAKHSPFAKVTIVDHVAMTKLAEENVQKAGFSEQVSFAPTDLLDDSNDFPKGHDLIWMSQLLSCFSEDQVVQILKRVVRALPADGHLMIMETFTDNQKFDVSTFCLNMTSLYFTAVANGNSRLYPKERMIELIEKAGLEVAEEHSNFRLYHTILKCRVAT